MCDWGKFQNMNCHSISDLPRANRRKDDLDDWSENELKRLKPTIRSILRFLETEGTHGKLSTNEPNFKLMDIKKRCKEKLQEIRSKFEQREITLEKTKQQITKVDAFRAIMCKLLRSSFGPCTAQFERDVRTAEEAWYSILGKLENSLDPNEAEIRKKLSGNAPGMVYAIPGVMGIKEAKYQNIRNKFDEAIEGYQECLAKLYQKHL